MSEQSERIVVTGRVQGVFFRKWAQGEAERLELRGVVRNVADGSVEAKLTGSAQSLDAFAAAAREGPPKARVERVDRAPVDATEVPAGQGVRIADDV